MQELYLWSVRRETWSRKFYLCHSKDVVTIDRVSYLQTKIFTAWIGSGNQKDFKIAQLVEIYISE